jgi:thymidylate kinase
MSESANSEGFVAAVFSAWRRENVEFLVLRNYEGLPAYTTNDIDVLVRRRQRRQAEKVLLAVAREHGFRLHIRAAFATLALYFHHSETLEQVHFDLFSKLLWRALRYLDCDEFLLRRVERDGFYVPRPVDEAATSLLSYGIHSGKVKPKYQAKIAAAAEQDGEKLQNLLARSFGGGHARRVVEAAVKGDWASIEQRIPRMRMRLFLRHLNRHPVRLLCNCLSEGRRVILRFLRPPGMVIALCGPDGCGKSTLADLLAERLAPTFSPEKSAHYHWKPPVFSTRRRAMRKPSTDPHAQPPRSAAVSLLFFAFHWLEFLLGSHIGFRRTAFRGGLILIDRFYYDFFIDQRRYRLQVPHWMLTLGLRFLRQPDIAVFLDAPPDVLRARKQELPPEEVSRQRGACLQLARELPNSIVIDASQPSQKVAEDLARAVLLFLSDRRRDRAASGWRTNDDETVFRRR